MLSEAREPNSINSVPEQRDNVLTSNSKTIFIVLLIIAAFTRFWDIGAESFWYDEYALLDHTESFTDTVEGITDGDPPLIIVLGYLWGQIFGNSEAGARSLSAVLGVASIVVLYLVAKQLFNEQIALIAAGLATFSGYLIFYSQDYRYYSLLVFVTLLSYYFIIQALHTKHRWYFIPYAVFSALAYYTHLFGVFMIFAQGVYLLLFARKYKPLWLPWFFSQILTLALIIPHLWLVFFAEFMDSGSSTRIQWVSTLIFNSPFIATVKYIILDESYLRLLPLVLAGLVFVAGLVFYIAQHGVRYVQMIKEAPQTIKSPLIEQREPLLLIVTWYTLIMFTPYLLEFVVGPMFLDRYVIGVAPAFYMLLAWGLWYLRRLIPLYSSIGALLVVMIFGLTAYYGEPTREEWGQVFNTVEVSETDDGVIIYNLGSYNPRVSSRFNYAASTYYDGSLVNCNYYEDLLSDADFNSELARCVGDADYVWIVMREYQSSNDRVDALTGYLSETFDFELVNHTFYYGLQLIEYQRSSDG